MKIKLDNVTLLGIDCVNVERLQKALDISCVGIDFGQVKLLTSLPTNDSRKVAIPYIDSIEKYSEFCIKDLYKYVDTDFVLLVQYDGFVLNADSWNNDFLNYDYIGAPWAVGTWETDHFPKDLYGTKVVGNGGFSLRSKKFLQTSSQLAKENVITKYQPEDVALCVWYKKELEECGIKFSPVHVAEKFSFEGEPDQGQWTDQFGFHGLKWSNINNWIEKNPQWGISQELN